MHANLTTDIRTHLPFADECTIAFHHIPSFDDASDISFLQAASSLSLSTNTKTTNKSSPTDHDGTTDACGNLTVPRQIEITQDDLENAPDAGSSYEDNFFPAGRTTQIHHEQPATKKDRTKLLRMEIEDPNQMLSKKQLEVFRKTCLKKEVYDALTDDLTGKIKHSLQF